MLDCKLATWWELQWVRSWGLTLVSLLEPRWAPKSDGNEATKTQTLFFETRKTKGMRPINGHKGAREELGERRWTCTPHKESRMLSQACPEESTSHKLHGKWWPREVATSSDKSLLLQLLVSWLSFHEFEAKRGMYKSSSGILYHACAWEIYSTRPP